VLGLPLGASAQAKHSQNRPSSPPPGKAQFDNALAAYRTQRYATAERELQPLLKANPNSFEVNELAGLIQVAEGDDQKANGYLAKAARLRPKLVEAKTALAANLLRLHRRADAEAEFKAAVVLSPASYDANHNLGEFYIQTDQIPAAIAYLERAQRIDPTAYNNGYDLALAYEQTGDLNHAREQLRRLVQFKDSAEFHSLLGEIEEKSKNFVEAASEYEKAARIDPSEWNLVNWGAELVLHQTFEPAVQVFTAGLSRFPSSARLHNGLGIAFYGMGRFDDAARAFFHAADLDTSDPLPLTFVGKIYENLSPEIAAEVLDRLNKFVARDSVNAAVRFYYAMCLSRVNQTQHSPGVAAHIEALLKSAVTLDPHYAEAHRQLGIFYADGRNFGLAIAEYEQALKSSPQSASTHYRLGQALARSGQAERAKNEFALFEHLRQNEVDEANQERNQIQQFVYTMRKSTVSADQ
jgi:tetratricopeptide (TPR) repeat protein